VARIKRKRKGDERKELLDFNEIEIENNTDK